MGLRYLFLLPVYSSPQSSSLESFHCDAVDKVLRSRLRFVKISAVISTSENIVQIPIVGDFVLFVNSFNLFSVEKLGAHNCVFSYKYNYVNTSHIVREFDIVVE